MYSSTPYLSPTYPIPTAKSWKDLNSNSHGVPICNAPPSTVWGVQEIENWYSEHNDSRRGEQPLASALYRREQHWHTEAWDEDWCPQGTTTFVKSRKYVRPPRYGEDNPHPWTGDRVFEDENEPEAQPLIPPVRSYAGPSAIAAKQLRNGRTLVANQEHCHYDQHHLASLHDHNHHYGAKVRSHSANPIHVTFKAAPEQMPVIRVEEFWQRGKWRPVVPVDFKGLGNMPQQVRNEQVHSVQNALEEWQPSLRGAVHCGGLVPTRKPIDDCPIS